MMTEYIFNLYESIRTHNIFFVYKGVVTQDILLGFSDLIKDKFSKDRIESQVINKIFAIIIEMGQNIAFHSSERCSLDDTPKSTGSGILLVSEDDKHFYINTGNIIKNEHFEQIEEKCDVINELDKDGLKQYYKDQIRMPRKERDKGGNIGLVDIARKSENLLKYEMVPIDEKHFFLIFSVKVSKEDYNG